MPPLQNDERWLGPHDVSPVLVRNDCSGGFLYAYWRRPAVYLDAQMRSGSSSFWALGEKANAGSEKLRFDQKSGEWERRYAKLLALDRYGPGYRLSATA